MRLENTLRRELVKGAGVLNQEKSFGKRKKKKKIYLENKGMQVGIINVNQ